MTDGSQEDFAKQYTPMTEAELMDVARNYDDLVDPAQTALREEFARRGLEPPLIEEAFSMREQPRPNLVTVGTYRDMPEAFVARAVLEEAGIDCFLRDENTVRMDWLMSNMIGGMRLQVGKEDEVAARELLAQPMPTSFPVDSGPDFEQPVCPRCGSLDVMANDADRKILAASSFAGGLPMVLGVPALAFVEPNVWKCNGCGCKWTDDGDPDADDVAPLR